ncbi:hypothetical protein KEJ51_07215 [Candidatus Bathyarchaeota archaeon]|nr:hypothetical protein [Candidatus Bathyarchaeota archaeon]MBS7629951.1 hypothetical protein [Candidatus Bathyarchaeota archaeon]
MAVRVKIRINFDGKELETSALVNTGFETDQPEILLPARLAELLDLYPPKAGSLLQEYSVVGGTTAVIKSPEKINVQLSIEDRKTGSVEATALISDREDEVLISDSLASELRISIEDAKEGLWRLRDESVEKVRSTSKPQYW